MTTVTNDHRLRASDADRDAVITILDTAYGAGRITSEEHTERVEAALVAKTFGDLAPLTVDLVPQAPPRPSGRFAFAPDAASDSDAEVDAHRRRMVDVSPELISAVMTKQERHGTWPVPRKLRVNAFLGTVVLDFTQARMAERILDVECSLIMSTLKLRVPRGTNVRDGTARILADESSKQVGPFDENAPLILLSGTSALSDVKVRGPRGHSLMDYLGF